MIGGEIALIVWKIVISIFIISILSMVAYVAVGFVRIIRDAKRDDPKESWNAGGS